MKGRNKAMMLFQVIAYCMEWQEEEVEATFDTLAEAVQYCAENDGSDCHEEEGMVIRFQEGETVHEVDWQDYYFHREGR